VDTTPSTAAGRAGARLRSRPAGRRPAAAGTALLAVVLAAHLGRLSTAAPYLGLVAGCLVLLAVATTAWLWAAAGPGSRACACVLTSSLATGQALNALVGLPGATSLRPGIGGWGVVAVCTEVAVLVAVVSPGLRPKR
jgi:hypothetical protein